MKQKINKFNRRIKQLISLINSFKLKQSAVYCLHKAMQFKAISNQYV